MNLIERIDRWGRTAPYRLALASGDRKLTFGDLCRRSDLLASFLAHALPRGQSPVAVHGHKEPEMLIAMLGAVKAGHPYLALDIAEPKPWVDQIVAAAGASMVITPDSLASLERRANPRTTGAGSRPVGNDDPFCISFTPVGSPASSGSPTGDPAGVVVTRRAIGGFVDGMLEQHELAAGQNVVLNQAPFSLDLAAMDIYLALASGNTLYCLTQDDLANPARLYEIFPRSNISVWVSTPSFAGRCLTEKTFRASMLPQLCKFLFTGEALSPMTAAELLNRFPKAEIWNTYGAAETGMVTSSVRITRDMLTRYPLLPVGHPRPDGYVVIVRPDGSVAPDDAPGEIVVAGLQVSTRYFNRPDLAERFAEIDGMPAFHTGDWGYTRDGFVFCEGRHDNQIRLHGHRFDLEDVEAHLRELPRVRDAIVIPKFIAGAVDALAAFVILTEHTPGTNLEIARALRKQLAERLPAYMLPRSFVMMARFPTNSGGKPNRKRLSELLK